MTFEERYQQLNTAQRQAVDAIDGPVMVVAGPGTGKTELLSMRVANILRRTDTLPENILCLTYTDSGVTAMRERLISIIGQAAYKVPIHTFHSFGSDIIAQYREYFYHGALFQAADDISIYEVLRSLFESLPMNDPLASSMNGEYTYQEDARTAISNLKRAGLTSAELLAILDANDITLDQADRELLPIFDATVSKKMIEPLRRAAHIIKDSSSHTALYQTPPLADVLADSLMMALDEAEALNKTSPLTAWKARYFEKDKDKKLVFKARGRQRKLRSLAVIYDLYLRAMEQAALYDYDDMIMQVVHAIEVNNDLRYSLQERYQYLLVDEFQDTNLAQMRILHNLTDNPVNEGRPNIFIVGDDDQAIYSFQGADISNIRQFQATYPATKEIVLTENYRSVNDVLTTSRSVIVQGKERLENLHGINKQLTANVPDAPEVAVRLVQTDSLDRERQWLVEDIASVIENGEAPSTITVLTRRHSDIANLLPFFAGAGIAVSYERRDNILELEPIVILERIGRIIMLLSESHHDQANSLLSKLLSHPAWGFSSQDIWKLSTQAYDKRQRWLDAMEAFAAFTEFRSWLIDLVADAPHTPLEKMLDRMIGREESTEGFVSPLYRFYFSEEALASDPTRYLIFLEALRTLRGKLIAYHPDVPMTLASFISFIDLHRRIKSRIQLSEPIELVDAVRIMTAHSSKGLEFESVYIVGATDTAWGMRARSFPKLINYPENLEIAPAGDTYDERLRLFYVAMTRAKRHLAISYAAQDDTGKATLPASFLLETDLEETAAPMTTLAKRQKNAEVAWYQPVLEPTKDLQTLLLPRMTHYRLSATHLNAFLDVPNGGPKAFQINYLLHFPGAESVHAAYGSAAHRTLQQVHLDFNQQGVLKPVEDILRDFEANLLQSRMDPLDFDAFLQKGTDELTAYIRNRGATFSADQRVELDFAAQQVILGQARLTGKLDLVTVDEADKSMIVSDYKTGKPARNWQGTDEYEKVKLHKYRQQLLFYKLLVENSRDFSSFTVTQGCLEFIEPTQAGDSLSLELSFDQEEIDRLKRLIDSVWQHIITLELPDTSAYPPTLKGMLAFEDDLINGQV